MSTKCSSIPIAYDPANTCGGAPRLRPNASQGGINWRVCCGSYRGLLVHCGVTLIGECIVLWILGQIGLRGVVSEII